MIPIVDIAPLFEPPGADRDAADTAVLAAATGAGFMVVTDLPAGMPLGEAGRAPLLRFFALPEAARWPLARRKFAPDHRNLYRGYFPPQDGDPTFKTGIDLGPDIDPEWRGGATVDAVDDDPLLEPTPLPDESLLPGWRAAAVAYHRAMRGIAGALMRALARGLGLPETSFDAAFADGLSTLRLLRYPPRPDSALSPELRVSGDPPLYVVGRAHCDSGFVTLLSQDASGGLQARGPGGAWLDVPPRDDGLAVNFGQLLARWTGGRVRATEHRVVTANRERFSVPFFYEPAVDAVIRPLPLPGARGFAPFSYGDHLWESTTRFLEFRGMAALRRPRGAGDGPRSAV